MSKCKVRCTYSDSENSDTEAVAGTSRSISVMQEKPRDRFPWQRLMLPASGSRTERP